MQHHALVNPLSRRDLLKGSVATVALALAGSPAWLLGREETGGGETLIPFLDAQPVNPKRPMLQWDQLADWITPNEQLFAVSHYGTPTVEAAGWQLELSGLVKRPKKFSLQEIKSRRRKTVIATLECSGNGVNAGFCGAIGNLRWTGTPLAPLLRESGLLARGREIVFFGADEKVEKIREQDFSQNFARSLAMDDALRDEVLVAYEMNGEPLSAAHGAPLRLIVPGWFGIAWVKWLNRVEVLDRRYMSKYMAREYVTIRGEERDGRTIWRETSVGPMDVKSVIGRALQLKDGTVRLVGAAWTDGAPLQRIEVKIDDGPWLPATIRRTQEAKYAWKFFSFDWRQPAAGEHRVVSRAIDIEGRAQPDADDPEIKLKRTYWEANQQWPRKIRI